MNRRFSVPLALAMLSFAIPGYARTFHVENNALESDTCGSKEDPCRSIRNTIFKASDGDEILVGPGEYHDESAGNAMIIVDRRLSIVSRRGAAETIINVGDQGMTGVTLITGQGSNASDSVFGTPGHGFTVIAHGPNRFPGAVFAGIKVEAGLLHVTVEGNVAIGFERGFEIAGGEGTTAFNVAIGNGTGFYVGYYGNLLKRNVANANFGTAGIEVVQDGQTIQGNIVNANTFTGIRVSGTNILGTKHQITGNSVVGNGNEGVLIDSGSEAIVTGNNLYGTLNNCGLKNDANAGIVATGNYWGAASGPGSPPADNVCNIGGATTDVSGFLKKPVQVRSRLKLESGQHPIAIEAGENEGGKGE